MHKRRFSIRGAGFLLLCLAAAGGATAGCGGDSSACATDVCSGRGDTAPCAPDACSGCGDTAACAPDACPGCGDTAAPPTDVCPGRGDTTPPAPEVRASGEVAQPADPEAAQQVPAFSFLTGSDALSVALTGAFEAYVMAPGTDEAAQAMFRKQREAAAYFATHRAEAADLVLAELAAQPAPGERTKQLAFHLLGEIGGERAVQFLFDQARADIPPDTELLDSNTSPGFVARKLRFGALTALGRVAVQGDAAARDRLLDLVEAIAERDARALAIRFYYAASPSRSKAKAQLLRRLPPAERFLAHVTYQGGLMP